MKKKLTAAEFKAIHDRAESNAEAMERTGLSQSAYSMRVTRYRRKGINLKPLDDRKIDVEKINNPSLKGVL
jgi:transposase